MVSVVDRFLRYVAIDTGSRDGASTIPSTPSQFDLAKLLVGELKDLGLQDAEVDDHCYVMATLPSNLPANIAETVPVIGLLAHMDTSESASGKNVKPRIITYNGGDIKLSETVAIPEDNNLRSAKGCHIIVTDGTTLLGADDKAGIAEIMTTLERLIHEKKPHGTIRIGFTPDEEIGRGTDYFNIKKFGVHCAYTVDGGNPGEINQETFTADESEIHLVGKDIHPGQAKDVMVNAGLILTRLVAELPDNRMPEHSEKQEPYILMTDFIGGISSAKANFILRAFEDNDRQENRSVLQKTFERFMEKYPKVVGSISFTEQYQNMKKYLVSYPEVTKKLEEAVRHTGITPCWVAIRGGTDGARLSEKGLPTPNIFTGGRNFHSVTEWIAVEDMEKTVETLINLVVLWTKPD